ncbi:MAG: aminotransferase class V-fold PLP-dependent enzyme [Deltaproteobacteria bacterium]|nr:MAG: aminotransferase class V-fold PLP-dependent enzyme [Deltaproteobacteria bacterium]
MIPCQRELFEIPDDIAYFNCAYTAPLLRSGAAAGRAALQAKSESWTITSKHFFTAIEENRMLFGKLVACNPNHVAIIPAVSYGIALAAKNLPTQKGQSVLVLEDQFPSNVYAWKRLADSKGIKVATISRPSDHDWTSAVLEAIDSNTAIAAMPNCHWTDGTLVDLIQVGEKCREVGAALVVDGTQSLGAMPFSVASVQPDYLITTAHKWLLGPYSFGFCHIAPRWQTGVPLEENWLNRAGSEDFARLVDYRDEYQPGARRYDVGEASNFILAPIAQAALRQLLAWGVDTIAATLKSKTDHIASKARELGFQVSPDNTRAPHMLGLSIPEGLSENFPNILAQEKVFVSVRGNSIRVAPHVYNTEADVTRLLSALKKAIL